MKRALLESARDINRISLPVCAGFVVAFGHSLGFTHIVALFSPTDVAGYGIAYRIQNVVLMPAIALGVGLAININRMTAAREPTPLTRFLPVTMLLTTALYGGVGTLLFVGRSVVAQLSTGDAATAAATAEYLTYSAPAYPIVGAALMLSIFLEETGNGARALAFNAVLTVSQLTLAWYLTNGYHSLRLTYLAVALSSLAAIPFLAHEMQRSRRLGGRISAVNEPTDESKEHEDDIARRPAADRRPRARKAGAHRRVKRGYVPRHRRTD
jgi:Na+-driven multidrug efflux pump